LHFFQACFPSGEEAGADEAGESKGDAEAEQSPGGQGFVGGEQGCILLEAFFEVFPEGVDEGGGVLQGLYRRGGGEGQFPGAQEVQVKGGEARGQEACGMCMC